MLFQKKIEYKRKGYEYSQLTLPLSLSIQKRKMDIRSRQQSAKAHIPFPPLRNTSLSCFSTTRSIRTVQSFGSLCRTLRASFRSSSFDTIPIGSYSYVEIRLNLPWLSAVAQGSSRLAIEVNVEAHGLKDGQSCRFWEFNKLLYSAYATSCLLGHLPSYSTAKQQA